MRVMRSILVIGVFLSAGIGLMLVAHRQRWLPVGGGAAAAAVCRHELAPEACPFCTPDQLDEQGMCVEHGVAEALCWICRPALAAAYRAEGDWCGEHGLPESRCTLCNPEVGLDAATLTPAAATQPISVESDPDAPRVRRAPSVTCTTERLVVRLAAPAVADRAGLEYARIQRRPVRETLTANATLEYDRGRYAAVAPRASGVVRAVHAAPGQAVAAGDVLAVVESSEAASAEAEYLRARALVGVLGRSLAREQRLQEQGIGTEAELFEAETRLEEGRISLAHALGRLRTLGWGEGEVAALHERQAPAGLLAVTAPFAGTVIERHAVLGESADPGRPVFTVADLSQLWAILDVYEADLGRVRTDVPVVVTVDGLRGEMFSGRLTWLSSEVDPRTRTLKARAELDNAAGRLRANMFGRAVITLRDANPTPLVPRTAVQWDGCCNVAFVKRSDFLFEPRKLTLGPEVGAFYLVNHGLAEGETVVTTGSFVLKTEILKESIGAGCCEVGPPA